MKKIKEAQSTLGELGLPKAQQNEMAALTLLALCGIKQRDSWSQAERKSLTVTKGIMDFVSTFYKRKYAPNTRETFRRQVLHQFVQAGVADYNPDNPTLPTNSPKAHYAIAHEALLAIKAYGTHLWSKKHAEFIRRKGRLLDVYQKKRGSKLVPVTLPDGQILSLSPGKHNEVQAAIIQEFAPRFAPGAKVLYLGDTADKSLLLNKESFESIGVIISEHDKLPDVVILYPKKQWLFLIESVTSHGPMAPKRVFELEKMFRECKLGKVFVSAFPSFREFKKHAKEIAWATEIWIVEFPDHLIHYNGDRFLGPR